MRCRWMRVFFSVVENDWIAKGVDKFLDIEFSSNFGSQITENYKKNLVIDLAERARGVL